MFNVLLFLLGFITVETNRKYLLCNTPKFEVFFEMCDDSFPPVITLEPCELNRNRIMNFSMTIIPRKDIDRLYSKVQIWKESVTISDRKYVLCNGFDDEFDFCGALKGETLNLFYYDINIRKLQLIQDGIYTLKTLLLVGEKEEQLLCCHFTMKFKAKAH
ncbi:lymphocyte antigen 96 [Rhinoderma darwinii]|uniref:lymphocyte antigen 96 n=1 Tax=Rhinoderma darwinii TaxID=43563 RepID=UPI003F678CFD